MSNLRACGYRGIEFLVKREPLPLTSPADTNARPETGSRKKRDAAATRGTTSPQRDR